MLGAVPSVFAAGTDRIRVGLVGCGGRGLGAVRNCLAADPSVQLIALGDLFADRIDAAMTEFTEGATGDEPRPPLPADQFGVTRDRCFTGFDNHRHVLDSGIDPGSDCRLSPE